MTAVLLIAGFLAGVAVTLVIGAWWIDKKWRPFG